MSQYRKYQYTERSHINIKKNQPTKKKRTKHKFWRWTTIKMKNSLLDFKSRFQRAEETISEYENKPIEIMQSKEQKGKK